MAFLKNEFSVIHDPYLLADMKKGVERLHRAVTDGEKVLIYGDYDVDGVTSVSILYLYLKSQNVDVSYYIPSRMGDGYGLSCGAIDAHCAEADLIVTVDTGITAEEEVRHAKSLGIDSVHKHGALAIVYGYAGSIELIEDL